MITSRIAKWLVMATALLLMSAYLFLNFQKLLVLSTYWSRFDAGSAAPVASVKLKDEIIYEHRLNITDIFDATGTRQINIMPVPKHIFATIGMQLESTALFIDEQELPLSSSGAKSALLAMANDRKVYLVANDTLKPMMTVIWNEQRQLKNIIQCMTPDLCKTLLISSRNWGQLEGPFSDSDFSANRKSMPRGRWVYGPKTVFNIQSKIRQKVWLKISLLVVHPDQEVSFLGPVLKTRVLETQTTPLTAGGRSLSPLVLAVLLDFQPGSNGLEVNYKLWESPVGDSTAPVAAYITEMTFDKENSSEFPHGG
jgi:hypothetical protein